MINFIQKEYKMSIFTKCCWGITAVLLIATGIVCFCCPAETLAGISIFLGISLLISGIGSIASYFTAKKIMLSAGWLLLGGIATVVLGILVLSNSSMVAGALPIMFGMWIIVMGLIRIMSAFDMKRLGFNGWWSDVLWGALLIILGVLSFYQPIVSAVMITIITGVFFVLNGIAMMMELYFACKLENRAKTFLDKFNAIVVEPENVKNKDLPNE